MKFSIPGVSQVFLAATCSHRTLLLYCLQGSKATDFTKGSNDQFGLCSNILSVLYSLQENLIKLITVNDFSIIFFLYL